MDNRNGNGYGYWFHSLRWKFFIAFLMVSLLPLVFFAYTATSYMETYFTENNVSGLMRKVNIYSNTITTGGLMDETKESLLLTNMRENSERESFRILVLDAVGYVIMDTGNSAAGSYFITSEVVDALNNRTVSNIQNDKVSVYTAAPVKVESDIIGVVMIVSDISAINDTLDTMSNSLGLLTLLTTVVILVVVFFTSQIIISPTKKILKVVTLMSEGHLNQRISIKGHDEFYQLAEAFNNMNDKLEQVEKTREEFVSNVSHELKTPLSSIKVLSESILLQEDVPIEMYKEFLQDINSEVDRMTLIVNDLLTLVRLDQRSVALNIKQTDVNKVVEDVLKRLYPLAEQKGIELLYENVRSVVIDADEMKLSLAISNLVENGIKYTSDEGTVKVIVDADHQNAFITVQDTGIGIEEEEQSKIFTRFYRVDKTRDRGTGGTGLGLSITHSTVLLHNGSIRLTSKEGEGTTFIVRFPIHYAPQE